MKPSEQIKINKLTTADCGWTKPSITFNDLDKRVSNLTTCLNAEANNAPLLVQDAINLLARKGFQRLSTKEAALVENPLIQKDRDSRYIGTFVKEGLFAEVYKDRHWRMNQIPKTTHSFAKINFMNKKGNYLNSNCFCELHRESSN